MKILSTLAAMVVAFAIDGRAGSLYIIQQQAITGDHCQPVNSSVVYARDSGWITNTSGTTMGFVCPIKHVVSDGSSLYPYQREKMNVVLGYTLPSGGTINCSTVAPDVSSDSRPWGWAKVGTGSGVLRWQPQDLPIPTSAQSQLSIYCEVPAGGSIRGVLTEMY